VCSPRLRCRPRLVEMRRDDGSASFSPPLRGGRGKERSGDEIALNSTNVGRNPARVLPAPVGAISSAERSSRAFASSASWCSRGDHPRPANQRRKVSGRREDEKRSGSGMFTIGRLSRSCRTGRDIKSPMVPIDFRVWPPLPPDRAPARCLRCGSTNFPAARAQGRLLRLNYGHNRRCARSAARRRE
jgi:hypothetical protein